MVEAIHEGNLAPSSQLFGNDQRLTRAQTVAVLIDTLSAVFAAN